MARPNDLSLPEEILLLALHDEAGTIEMGSMYGHAVGGAVLAELVMRQRVRIDDTRQKRVHVADSAPTGRPFLDDCLARIDERRSPAAARTWVSKFAQTKDLKHRLAQQLCDRGILRADEDTVLLLFTRRIYPEIDPGPERELVDRLRHAIFTETQQLDPRTVVLVSLADSAGLLKNAFDKRELKGRKDRIERIVAGEVLGEATKQAIEAVQAAVMVATMVPVITAATSGG